MEMLYAWLVEPLEYDFMLRAFASIILIGTGTAMLGCYVVLRKSVFITSALSHTILPGVVGAALLGVSLYLGAFAAALVTALGVGLLSSRQKMSEDSAIGVLLAFMFALGILLMTLTQSFRDFASLLFGSVLGVSGADLGVAAGTCLAVLLFFVFFRVPLKLASCDPEYAQLAGARPQLMQVLFLSFVALASVASVRIIGALLTTALLVIPAASAQLLTRSVGRMMAVAVAISIVTGIAGLYASYYVDGLPAGASIVVAESLVFFAAWVLKLCRDRF